MSLERFVVGRYDKLFIYIFTQLKVSGKKRGEKFQLKGGRSEVNFGYHPEMGGYTTLMSDIPELYAIMEEERLMTQRKVISFQRKGALGT